MEAESDALTEVIRETQWLKNLYSELNKPIKSLTFVTMWSGTARFRNPHIKWPEAMAGIPLELQVKERKEGKRE